MAHLPIREIARWKYSAAKKKASSFSQKFSAHPSSFLLRQEGLIYNQGLSYKSLIKFEDHLKAQSVLVIVSFAD